VKLPAALLLFASFAFAATPIGVVTASGAFQMEGSRIWGNSTLFDGAKIVTTDASSELALSSGVKIQLAAGSSARVWKGRLDLERGTGQVTAPSSFQVGAGGMTVDGSRYRVGLQGSRVEVASFSGDARVRGSLGNVLAAVPAGRNMNFAMQQVVTRAGCLVYKAPGFLMQVDNSAEVIQLTGNALPQNVGNRVEITGTASATAPTVSPATTLINVTTIAIRATGGCLTTAAALNAQTSAPAGTPTAATPTASTPVPTAPEAPAATSGGLSTGAKIGIIAAIGGGGAGAAIALGGKKSSTSR
jgi:hypothetical protein